MTALYHFWSSLESQSVRMALAYLDVPFEDHPLAYLDDETFFSLGVARAVPLLVHDNGRRFHGAVAIFEALDSLYPSAAQARPLLPTHQPGALEEGGWREFLAWRERTGPLRERLIAPVRLAFRDLAFDESAQRAYRNEVRERFGLSVEELASDRYEAWRQFERLADLKGLARRLARQRYYTGRPSAIDMWLAADLFALSLLDGVGLPLDLLYYVERVETLCGRSPREGLAVTL